jgi:hypothetical protein
MFLEEDTVTRKLRTRLRRAIGLGLALGVVIAPNALAKPLVSDSSGGSTPSTTTAPPASTPAANNYGFHHPEVASPIAIKEASSNGFSFHTPMVTPAKVTYYDAWHVPARSSAAGTIAVTHDTWGGDIRASRVGVTRPVSGTTFHDSWGKDVRTAVTSQPAATGSSSNDTRNVLLAASAAGLLLIGGGSLVLMLRRRRAQLA